MKKGKVVFAIHGGAGTIDIPPEKEQAYLYFAKEISHTNRCNRNKSYRKYIVI